MENKNWKNLSVIQTIKSNMGILAGLVILCVVLSFTTSSFATVTNLFNVVRQITINLFLACGMTFVILLAGIDLSVGSVIAFQDVSVQDSFHGMDFLFMLVSLEESLLEL